MEILLRLVKEVVNMLSIILGGLVGGALRGVMGIAKTLVTKKEDKINYDWLFVSIVLAMAIGVIAATFMGGGFEMALLAGYAGSDLLEGLFKLKFKEKFEKLIKK